VRREQRRSSPRVRFFFSTSSLDEEAKAAGAARDEARQHESLSSRGPSWSVNELVRGSGNRNNSSGGGGGGGAISEEEFRKIAESVKLSFNDREEEQLARREVEEIVRFSEMVLSSSSSSDVKEGDDEQRLNGPTPRRRMDE
jgi:hypothetical protein